MTGQTTPGPASHRYRADTQRRAIADLMDRLRTEGGVRLVTGEPGCGRSAFLAHAARSFRAGPVWHLRADPADSARPRSGLHGLLRALGRPGPPPAGPAGDTLLAALREAAGPTPHLLCVDDAHLWDPASRAALGEAAARVRVTGGAGLLLAVPGHRPTVPELAGLPAFPLAPLTPHDAAQLLDEATDHTVDPAVRAQLVSEADGSPALLLALAHRLSPAQLRGHRELPVPVADGEVLDALVGGHLAGLPADHTELLLTVAAAERAGDTPGADAALVHRAAPHPGHRAEATGPATASPFLVAADGRLRFRSPLLGRAVYATAPPERRRAAHRALAGALPAGLPALLHRSWTVTGPAPHLASALSAAAADPATAPPPAVRRTAHTRAAELSADDAERARQYTAAAEQALLAGDSPGALRLLDAARSRPVPTAVRGRTELLRGRVLLADGPVDDARESFLLAAGLLAGAVARSAAGPGGPPDPEPAVAAELGAADAAWAAGDSASCLRALTHGHGEAPRPGARGTADATAPSAARPTLLHDHRDGMRAVLLARFDLAAGPLRRVVDRGQDADDCEELMRAAAAALMLGEVTAARRAGARALAAARTAGYAALEARALEYLAYADLRAGRHQLARAHAEEGLRAARRAAQRNTAAHHHAVLALAASIEGDPVTEHVTAALTTARRHGLAQAATLAQWAAARADLGAGRPREAADRLGPLVRPGPRRGHFAVWMLAVPCYVEAAVLAGHPEHARAVVEDFALWAACGADPQAPAQLLRCRALLAPPSAADELFLRALDSHERTSGAGDFERARTELLHGMWLRRRRRLREARTRLGEALLGFERCGAQVWARQAGAELRANGAAPGTGAGESVGGTGGGLSRLTPQQLRIARRVAEGATNREVALSLSVSTRTVDYHLRNVFATLGVRSRVELVRLVEQEEKTGAQL
ncbi:LuxR C-terminal-related transcriptional regulator [Streptomyces sp. NPDC029526]|uniref:helix-turn-helix transcriptional regulator n=1 Tax=Streptomyces sp. NPDC029526 TaxID=3155728 RepID=UPI0033E4652E